MRVLKDMIDAYISTQVIGGLIVLAGFGVYLLYRLIVVWLIGMANMLDMIQQWCV